MRQCPLLGNSGHRAEFAKYGLHEGFGLKTAPARPLCFKARADEAPHQHTIVLVRLSQRQDDLYIGLIRHRTFCDDEHSYLCVSDAICREQERDGDL